ncbi:hypothetical protein DPQ22_03585 [Candidatus Tokpelaia sp.]|nr:hypothetical protein DPQ22_03585 [Candidatus Tokpelaia sp.]
MFLLLPELIKQGFRQFWGNIEPPPHFWSESIFPPFYERYNSFPKNSASFWETAFNLPALPLDCTRVQRIIPQQGQRP